MGIFGKSKKKKQQQALRAQQALAKAKQEREAAEAAQRKRDSEALQQRQAEVEAEEEKKEEEPPVVEKDQSLNETIDTAEEEQPQDQSQEEPQPSEISISNNAASDEIASSPVDLDDLDAEEPMEQQQGENDNEPAIEQAEQEQPAAPVQANADDAAWTPFEEDPFAAATYESWQFEEEPAQEEAPDEEIAPEEKPTEEEPAPDVEDEVQPVASADDIMNDLEHADAEAAMPYEGEPVELSAEDTENKEGAEDQPPLVEAGEGTSEEVTDKVIVEGAAEAPEDEKKEDETPKEPEKPKEPPFDSEKAFEKARELVDEAAITIGLAASAAYTMATACVVDIQSGFADEINDNMSINTKDTHTVGDDNTLDGTIDGTVDSRGNYTMDTGDFTDDDGSYSRTSRGTYDDASRYSRGSRGTYRDDASRYSEATKDDSVGKALQDDEPSRYRRYDDTQPKDDASKDETNSRTSRVTFQEPKEDQFKPLPSVRSQDGNDVDSAMGTVLAANLASTQGTRSSLSAVPDEAEESLDDVLNGSHSDVSTPPRTKQEESGQEDDDADGEYYALEDLQAQAVTGIDDTQREKYLSPSDFRSSFNMSKSEFEAMPKWKRDGAKKRVSLF